MLNNRRSREEKVTSFIQIQPKTKKKNLSIYFTFFGIMLLIKKCWIICAEPIDSSLFFNCYCKAQTKRLSNTNYRKLVLIKSYDPIYRLLNKSLRVKKILKNIKENRVSIFHLLFPSIHYYF